MQIRSHNYVLKKKEGLVPVYINAITSSKSNSQIADIDMQIFVNLRGFAHPCGRHKTFYPVLKGLEAQKVLDSRFSHFVDTPHSN